MSVNWRLHGESNIRSVFLCERLPDETDVLIPVEFNKFLKLRATLSQSASSLKPVVFESAMTG